MSERKILKQTTLGLVLFFSLFSFSVLGGLHKLEFKENSFFVYKTDLSKEKVEIHWKDESGERFQNFENLRKSFLKKEAELLFAMNAGIFEPDFKPTGLYIENSKIQNPLNLKEGKGNFYLKPNGVFIISDRGASIINSTSFSKFRDRITFATQSGPILVLKGKIHPAFNQKSLSKKIRNGVGIQRDGNPVFVISNSPITFYEFAFFFKEKLGCENALYLDGVISKIWSSSQQERRKLNKSGDFSGIISVSKKLASKGKLDK